MILLNWIAMAVSFRLSVGSLSRLSKVLNFTAALLNLYVILDHYRLI